VSVSHALDQISPELLDALVRRNDSRSPSRLKLVLTDCAGSSIGPTNDSSRDRTDDIRRGILNLKLYIDDRAADRRRRRHRAICRSPNIRGCMIEAGSRGRVGSIIVSLNASCQSRRLHSNGTNSTRKMIDQKIKYLTRAFKRIPTSSGAMSSRIAQLQLCFRCDRRFRSLFSKRTRRQLATSHASWTIIASGTAAG